MQDAHQNEKANWQFFVFFIECKCSFLFGRDFGRASLHYETKRMSFIIKRV
jgi:hypothetical protein